MSNMESKSSLTVSNYAYIGMRVLAIISSLISIWVMLTSKQSTMVYGISMDAKYSYSSAFKFYIIANAIASAFPSVSLILIIVLSCSVSNPAYHFILFLHDLIMTMLVMAGCGAATAISFVGKYGNSHTGWMAICDNFVKFCDDVSTSLILSYISLLLLFTLTIISANKSRHTRV